MAGGNDLTAAFPGHLGEQAVDLALAKDFEVGVRFVEKQNRPRIHVHVRQKKQGLLKTPARGGKVELDALLPVGHRDFAALRNVARRANPGTEQALDLPGQPVPHSFVFFVDLQTEVAQHLRGAAFSYADVYRPFIETCFRGREPRHGRQERDPYGSRFHGDRHALGGFSRGQTERPAVEGLVVGVVELQPAGPGLDRWSPLRQ